MSVRTEFDIWEMILAWKVSLVRKGSEFAVLCGVPGLVHLTNFSIEFGDQMSHYMMFLRRCPEKEVEQFRGVVV